MKKKFMNKEEIFELFIFITVFVVDILVAIL